ncbi:MAG: Surfeit locus 1 family protein [Pseudomonas fluorescens]|nr:MAG: Surfeit locus 1 family protein [Pseudomonas fluorescens]
MARVAFALLLILATGTFLWLGVWQIERLQWKRDLIAQTTTRLSAPAIPAPLSAGPQDAYTRVTTTGTYLTGKDTFVVASTRYGRGFWVLTPLHTDNGTILINRGFITSTQRTTLTTLVSPVTVTGLLRLTEPNGTLIQSNKPSENRWYTRDVVAIAHHHNLTTLPYFIDADATAPQPPIGGLTIIEFRNNHLQYALTWFCMTILSLVGLVILFRKPKTKPDAQD